MFKKFSEEYLRAAFQSSPTLATSLGVHDYDNKVDDVSPLALALEEERLRAAEDDLKKYRRADLPTDEQFDYDLIRWNIQSGLFALTQLRPHAINPMWYDGFFDVSPLLLKNFAPLEDRARSIVARQKEFSRIVASAKENLLRVLSKEILGQTFEVLEGRIAYLKEDLPAALKGKISDALFTEFSSTNTAAISAVEDFISFLHSDREPEAEEGAFRLGLARFSDMVKTMELVDTYLDDLLYIGEEELGRLGERFKTLAAQINPSKTPAEVFHDVESHHSTAEKLVSDTEAMLERIRQFLIDKNIISLPSDVRCKVMETPRFARWAFAMMDSPGAFETKAKDAYYYITPPETTWSTKQQEEWLRGLNKPVLEIISIHEAYPGHYVHFQHYANVSSNIAKAFWSYHFIEGWAHYTEQMMVEEGYGAGDAMIALAQTQEALVRCCRFIGSIKMHTEDWSVEQAATIFEEHAYMNPIAAKKEALRGTFDPGYMNYMLGKFEILSLREECKAGAAEKFSLRAFHDKLLSYGAPPVAIIREDMISHFSGE